MLVEQSQESSNRGLFRILDDFVKTSPCSLLIRGEPGQGKTTFVLTFMSRYRGTYRGYYVSTRVSLEKLEQQFSWIRGILSKESILEAERSSKQDLKGFDARIGRAKNLTEIVTNAALGESALIVLDSWDTLAKETPFEERAKTERMITTIADAHNSLLIFVGEEDEYSRNTAYLVDGIITLSSERIDGVKIRKLTIDKMRGTSIPRRDMLYTLDNSRFEVLPRLETHNYAQPVAFEPVKIRPGHMSTGNIGLDSVLDDIHEGTLVLLEAEEGTMRLATDLVVSSFVLNALSNRLAAISVNAPDTPAKESIRLVKPFISESAARNYRVLSHGTVDDALTVELSSDEGTNHEILLKEYASLRARKGGGQVVISLDLGLATHDETTKNSNWKTSLIELCRKVRENGDLLVMVNRTGLDSISLAKTIADVHLQILNNSGVHFLRVQKPSIEGPTILFSISEGSRDYPAYTLKSVV